MYVSHTETYWGFCALWSSDLFEHKYVTLALQYLMKDFIIGRSFQFAFNKLFNDKAARPKKVVLEHSFSSGAFLQPGLSQKPQDKTHGAMEHTHWGNVRKPPCSLLQGRPLKNIREAQVLWGAQVENIDHWAKDLAIPSLPTLAKWSSANHFSGF